MKKDEKLTIIDEAIEIAKEFIKANQILFLCNDTKVCSIPEVGNWIKEYNLLAGWKAFHHNPFTGKDIGISFKSTDKQYSEEKLIILQELRKRIENDEELTIHEDCYYEEN